MDNNNEKQITVTEPTVIPIDPSITPPTAPKITVAEPTITPNVQNITSTERSITPNVQNITSAEPSIKPSCTPTTTSNKQTIISTKSEITPTESISVKLAVTPTEPTITPTESKITMARPRNIPVELIITSPRPRITLTEPIKTPIEKVLVIKDHIIRPNQPLFYVKNPKGWFNQFESKILAADLIEDLPVYYDLLKELNNHDILCCILDVFQNMSMVNKYMYFRSHLLKKISEQERLIELVNDLKLEDKYPSVLLNEMKQLTDDKLLEQNLQRLWLQKLPPQVRDILLLSSDSLSSKSLLADNIKDLHYSPEAQLSKEAAKQYEHEHGLANSADDHQTENAQPINNKNSIQKEKKKSCLNSFCKCI
ncbi:uncharacterized protein LOC132935869 [Metopolophium dirhodum]|uniref:uncharacterized protein LOC132935869 n=1 Tax=Metopolophium dirhodum TaxID=44670 RepID=UPI00298FCE46|nr:uncharacterized protein LOC132935869 [Metopolophium dirhodum]